MASAIAVQFDPMFKAYYEKKAAQGLRYMNIIGHVTKKMAEVIFAVMRDSKLYEPVLPAPFLYSSSGPRRWAWFPIPSFLSAPFIASRIFILDKSLAGCFSSHPSETAHRSAHLGQ